MLLLVGAALVAAGVIAYLLYKAEQKRRHLLQSFAQSSGWTYIARDDSWADRFVGEPFGRGDDRRVSNILAGRHHDHDMVAFDYSYETSSTDSKGHRHTTTHRYAVCVLRLPVPLPGLELSPESVLTRFAGALGFDDVELESEDFNRRYRVAAREPKFAYDVLHPRTMEALLARPPLHLRLVGADAVCWESGRLEATDLLERLSTLEIVVGGIPSYVWSDNGFTAPGGATA
jgi:hypothetical protein